MQIDVIDDASRSNEAERIVNDLGKGRISYFLSPSKLGQFRTFNVGIRRAKGTWLHILHDDDWVAPGFYLSLQRSLQERDDVHAAATATSIIDANGQQVRMVELQRQTPGVLDHWLYRLSQAPILQTPSVVVRRTAYETLGGFDVRLTSPGDWEMWLRIASHYLWWYEPAALAMYRLHPRSNSTHSKQHGINIREAKFVIDCARSYLPLDIRDKVCRNASNFWAMLAEHTAKKMIKEESRDYAKNQIAAGIDIVIDDVIKSRLEALLAQCV